MNRLRTILICGLAALAGNGAYAQFNDSGISAGFFDSSQEKDINFSEFHLPPLAVLLENAKTTPLVMQLAKAQELAEKEVTKEKLHPLSYITGHANYSYGVTDLWGNNSSTVSSLVMQFQGTTQHYWNIGVNLNLPLDDVLDLGGRVRRSRLEAEIAQQKKDEAFDELKLRIGSLYVKITNDLIRLKTASENAAIYQGAGFLNKEDFHQGNMSIEDYAWTKLHEDQAVTSYQELQTAVVTDILTLEVLTHTPIITNSTTEITLDNAVQKSDKQIKRENRQIEKRIKSAAADDRKKIEALEKAEKKARKAAEKAASK